MIVLETETMIQSPVTTTGEALLDLLEQFGVQHVFGIPGVHTIELYRGLNGRTGVCHVLAKHEQGAGFMADGYARSSGKPGVCFFITGPGITNAVTAIGQAYSDSVPMLIIASANRIGDMGRQRGRLHETKDQRAILEPVTAFAATAHTPDDVAEYVNRAFAVFNTRRPRPVYIEIPLDVLAMPVERRWSARSLSKKPGPLAADVERAAQLLVSANRPVMICGGGARGAAGPVGELAQTLGAPVFSTIAGKGIIEGDDPLFLDATLHLPAARSFFGESDVALAIGTELGQAELLTFDPMPAVEHFIRIDIDHEQLCDLHATTLPILSDAEVAVTAILDRVRALANAVKDNAYGAARALPLRSEIRAELTSVETAHQRALEFLRRHLPTETIIATDMTMIAYTGNFLYPLPMEGRWLHPVGYGALGYALPAAIGAHIAQPGRPVAVIVGDGGFQFTLPELAVIAELELPILIIIWNNACYGMIKAGMHHHDVDPIGVDYLNPDFVRLAQAYGIEAAAPATEAEAAELLDQFGNARGPRLIELSPRLFDSPGEP